METIKTSFKQKQKLKKLSRLNRIINKLSFFRVPTVPVNQKEIWKAHLLFRLHSCVKILLILIIKVLTYWIDRSQWTISRWRTRRFYKETEINIQWTRRPKGAVRIAWNNTSKFKFERTWTALPTRALYFWPRPKFAETKIFDTILTWM